ncbi:unnamed protein product [Toxocara canis]|uniref:CC domain-containing protein n=1 Tax=Toxocara canis TaxID=6265 RepID=A0A183V7L7_TOXCA|nr:unnamed protein product [Toxocara canis]
MSGSGHLSIFVLGLSAIANRQSSCLPKPVNACNYYSICINGGMKLNIGCTADVTCKLYNVTYVCIQGCCCTTPELSPSMEEQLS